MAIVEPSGYFRQLQTAGRRANWRYARWNLRAKTSVFAGGAFTGLQVTVDILDKVYDTGRKCAKGFKQNMKIMFDDFLPQWNYRVVPPVT